MKEVPPTGKTKDTLEKENNKATKQAYGETSPQTAKGKHKRAETLTDKNEPSTSKKPMNKQV